MSAILIREVKRRTMKELKCVFSLAAALCLVGQNMTSKLHAADGVQTNITVEVIIFSGRPNPTWPLQDTNHLRALKAKLKDLPEAFTEEPAEWSRLGFAGFLIRGGEVMGLPGEIRLYQGVIKTGRGKEARYLKDLGGLEQSIITESKRQALAPPVRDAIASYENERIRRGGLKP
jgi:hypothetical protein